MRRAMDAAFVARGREEAPMVREGKKEGSWLRAACGGVQACTGMQTTMTNVIVALCAEVCVVIRTSLRQTD